MPDNKKSKKSHANTHSADEVAVNGNDSLLRTLHNNLKRDDRLLLFRAVAERIKTGLLTDDEAQLIAGWFDDMADGKKPADVLFGERRGRHAGSNGVDHLKGQDVSLPNHVDLCWTMRRAIAQTGSEDQVFGTVAERFGKTIDHIQKLYRQIEPTLGPDPDIQK